MSTTFEYVEGLPVLVVIGKPPLEAQDARDTMEKAIELKQKFPGKKIYRLMDFTRGIDFSGMMVCMAEERNKEGGSNDPDIVTFFVGSDELVDMGVQALREQPHYGSPSVSLFTSYDKARERALREAREQ